jgi:hypothetical protein
MGDGEIDEDVLRRGAAEIRERFAAEGHPLGQVSQNDIEQEIVNWVKIHPEDVTLSPNDIFIKMLESKLRQARVALGDE